MTIRYSTFDSDFGNVFLAKTEQGVCRASLGGSEKHFTTSLLTRLHQEALRDDAALASESKELRSYFADGKPIDGMPVEFLEGTPFEKSVWKVLSTIPFGEVRSYRWVASAIGNPKASRAVGRACGSNPIPFIIPCHRVIASNGGLGGYGYGLEVKRRLLKLEGYDISKLRN